MTWTQFLIYADHPTPLLALPFSPPLLLRNLLLLIMSPTSTAPPSRSRFQNISALVLHNQHWYNQLPNLSTWICFENSVCLKLKASPPQAGSSPPPPVITPMNSIPFNMPNRLSQKLESYSASLPLHPSTPNHANQWFSILPAFTRIHPFLPS